MQRKPFLQRLKHPSKMVAGVIVRLYRLFPNDKIYLKLIYRLYMGRKLDLKNPKTFSEKIQWLKLYDRRPEYTIMVDKYTVKQYVAERIGEEYIIPTIGVWESPEKIDWDSLPDKFVLKVTHGGGGGGIIICKDKKRLNKARAINMLKKAMKVNIYGKYREWPYKNVPMRIIAEQLLEEKNEHGLMDYKIFCFHGIPKIIKVNYDTKTDYHSNWYDLDWKYLGSTTENDPTDADVQIPCPIGYDKMILLAEKLSNGMPFVRVDFYNVWGMIKFGEMTFFPGSGFEKFVPESFDYDLGKMIKL